MENFPISNKALERTISTRTTISGLPRHFCPSRLRRNTFPKKPERRSENKTVSKSHWKNCDRIQKMNKSNSAWKIYKFESLFHPVFVFMFSLNFFYSGFFFIFFCFFAGLPVGSQKLKKALRDWRKHFSGWHANFIPPRLEEKLILPAPGIQININRLVLKN